MKTENLSEYLRYNIICFKANGIWIDIMNLEGTPYSKIIYSFVVNTLFILAPQICHVIYMYKARNNVVAFADEFSVSLSCMMVMLKMFTMVIHLGVIQSLITSMDDDIFQPKNLSQKKMTKKVMGTWTKIYWTYAYLEVGFCAMYLVSPLIDSILNGRKLLPLVDCYPFPVFISPTYEFMYIYQSLLLIWLCCESTNMDTLITGLISFAGLQCDFLCDNLKNLELERDEYNEEHRKLYEGLVRLIEHFDRIDKFVKEVNSCFSWNLLEQFACSVIIFCTTMFRMSQTEATSKEFITLLFYQCSCLTQLFNFCWTGTELTEKSDKILSAAYHCDWVGAEKGFKTTLLNFAQRTGRPLKIMAVLFPVSLDMFGQILKSSFSYYTMLNTLNEK